MNKKRNEKLEAVIDAIGCALVIAAILAVWCITPA